MDTAISKSAKALSFQVPLWYNVAHHHLSFNEFFKRFTDKLFHEKDSLPICVLATMYEHDPYVEGIHILKKISPNNTLNEKVLKCYYLFWVFGRSFSNDTILSGSDHEGTFNRIEIRFPIDFNDTYIHDWIHIILRSFFRIGATPLNITFDRGNVSHLMKALKYGNEISKERFILANRNVEKLYRLSYVHDLLSELKSFFQGKAFPTILKSYRSDPTFFKSVVDLYWPNVLKSLEIEKPFDDKELQQIFDSHRLLHESGDIDFFFFYVDSFNRLFKEGPLKNSLNGYVEPSKAGDSAKIFHFMKQFNPIQRARYFCQNLPFSTEQLTSFCRVVGEKGFEEAIQLYILRNKESIMKQVSQCGTENEVKLYNEMDINQVSIFLYPFEELIFYADKGNFFVFLREELENAIKSRENPYNRELLPNYLFDTYLSDSGNHQSCSLENLWSDVLRRKIDLSNLTK